MGDDDRVRQACAFLRMLLLRPGEYRATWERTAPPTPPEEINYAAVAAVLKAADPDAARRALEGEALDADLLAEFTRAFSLRPRHAERLADPIRGLGFPDLEVRPPTLD